MIGIDITAINRYKKIKQEHFYQWNKYFSSNEWQYCFTKAHAAQHLASIFACKEAIMKACGEELLGSYDRIEIIHLKNGKPVVFLDGKANLGVHISISHDSGFAIAVAVKLLNK